MNENTSDRATTHPLVMQHMPLVYRAARAEYGRLGQAIEFDDLVALGTIGLCEAARRFDPKAGASFATFASYRVRGAMYDGVGNTAILPRRAFRTRTERQEPVRRVSFRDSSVDRAHAQKRERSRLPDRIDQLRTLTRLPQALAQLSESERYIVRRCDLEGITLTQTSRELGLSKSAACRLRGRALRSLRRILSRAKRAAEINVVPAMA